MELIAREKIKCGSIVSILWKHYCRNALPTDTFPQKIVGFSKKDYKKGELVEILIKPKLAEYKEK